jgi:hypothetical protein
VQGQQEGQLSPAGSSDISTNDTDVVSSKSGLHSSEESRLPVPNSSVSTFMQLMDTPDVRTQDPDSFQPMHLLPYNYTSSSIGTASGHGPFLANITAANSSSTGAGHDSYTPVRANDLSHIALFCFMLGILAATALSQAVSYYEHWAKERVPRYIAQLEARVVAMLHSEQHSAVKALLNRELPSVVSAKGDDHVDTAAFRHFLSKALLALREHCAAEALLHKVVRCYEGYGEDLYMAHALEDLALAQQHQGSSRKLGVALGTMRHALRIYCEEAWAVKNATSKDGKAVKRRLYVETDSEGTSSLSTPDSLCLSTHSPLSVRRSSGDATPATSGKRITPSEPRRRSGTDNSSSHTLMHGYIDAVLNMSADSEGTVMDGLLTTPSKPYPPPQTACVSASERRVPGSLPHSRSNSPVLSASASPISYAVSDFSEYFSFLGADESEGVGRAPSAEDLGSAMAFIVAVTEETSGYDATLPTATHAAAGSSKDARPEDEGKADVPTAPAGLSSAEKCGASLRQALEELESLLLEPSLTSTALQQHTQHHPREPAGAQDPLFDAILGGDDGMYDVFRSYASPERSASRGFGQVGTFQTPVSKNARTNAAASTVETAVYPACPHVARVLQRVAVLLRELGRPADAVMYWGAAKEVCCALYGAESAEVSAVVEEILREQRRLTEQEVCSASR